MITADLIMSTRPCSDYPRDVVERILSEVGPLASWEDAAIAARDRGWRDVTLPDLRLTVYRAATLSQRRISVVHSTHLRVEAQIRIWPAVSPVVSDVRRRLLAWSGDHDEVRSILVAAANANAAASAASSSAYDAYAAAVDTAAYAAAVDTAAYAAAVVYSAAADAVDAYAAAAADGSIEMAMWDSLIYICRVLDGTAPPEEVQS